MRLGKFRVQSFARGVVLGRFFSSDSASVPILVVGGGSGGLAVAQQLSRASKSQIGLVEPAQDHFYQPLWTFVGAGESLPSKSARNLDGILGTNQAIQRIHDEVQEILPEESKVVLKNGMILSYGHLVLATGIRCRFDLVPGLLEALEDSSCPVVSNYTLEYAEKNWHWTLNVLEKRCADPVNAPLQAIFTFPNSPVKCPGAPQKAMYLFDDVLRNRGPLDYRKNWNISYWTPLPKMFSVPKYEHTLNLICDSLDLERKHGWVLTEVDGESRIAKFCELASGEVSYQKFDYLHVAPPQGPQELMLRSKSLTNEAGFVEVDQHTLQHKRFSNIFALGDCTTTPNSKTAAAAAVQSGVVVKNLLSAIENKPLIAKYDGYGACPIPVNRKSVVLCEFDYNLKPKETTWYNQAIPRVTSKDILDYLYPIYWELMVKGLWTGPEAIRRVLNFFRPKSADETLTMDKDTFSKLLE